MMNSSEKGPINIGNPHCEFTLNELVDQFKRLVGKRLEVDYIEATENDPKQRKPIIEKATTLLGWTPKVALAEGLTNTMNYFTSV